MDLLGEDRTSLPLFEPLHPLWAPGPDLDSIEGFIARRPDADDPVLEAHLTDILTGRVLNAWTLRDASMRQVIHADRVIAKMIRLCGAAGWLERRFPVVRTVAVVRHPCAVVASMCSASGRWREVPTSFFRDYAEAVLGAGAGSLLGSGDVSEVRRFAALWAVDNVALLRDSTPAHTYLVGFEELLRAPRAQLERVDQHLRLGVDVDVVDTGRASSTSGPQRNTPVAGELGRWKERLSSAEIDTIVGIAREVGISTVSTDPLPDMDAHRAIQADQWN